MAFKHVLITSGPAAVPIDEMRVLSNLSTGEMGRLIANAFCAAGWRVTLVESRAVTTSVRLDSRVAVRRFHYFDELEAVLERELRRGCRVLVHAAAVADFKLARPFRGKISSGKPLRLELVPTHKLIDRVKKISPDVFLVGFKFETRLGPRFILGKVKGLFEDAGCDLVVANCYAAGRYEAFLVDRSRCLSRPIVGKVALVKVLTRKVDQTL